MIDPSIPLSAIGQQPAVNPFQIAQSLQGMQIQRQNSAVLNEQRQALAEERQRKLADQDSLDAAVQPGLNIDQVIAKLPGHMHATVRKQFADADEANAKAKEARLKADGAEADYFGSLAASVKSYASQGPQSMLGAAQLAIAHAKASGHDTTQIEGVMQQNPTALPQMLDSLMAASPKQRELAVNDASAAKSRAELPGVQADAAVKQQVAAGTVNGLTPEQQATNRVAQQNARVNAGRLAEEIRNNKAKAQENAPLGGLLAGGTTGATAGALPNGDDLLKQLPSPIQTTVKALAEGRMAFPAGAAMRSKYWQDMVSLVGQYDPSFDTVNFNARSKTRQDFTSGGSAKQVNAIQTVIGHLSDLSDKSDALHNGDLQAWNWFKNKFKTSVGDAATPNFETIRKGVTDELTRVWRQSGGSEGDIKTWAESLNSSQSPAQFKGVLGTIGDMLESKLGALDTQYQQGMGTDKVSTISPNSRAHLDKLKGVKAPQNAAAAPKAGMIRARDPQGQLHEAPAGTALPAGWKLEG